MKEQTRFWYVHAVVGTRDVGLAVSAFTERSAQRQARKRLGPHAVIKDIGPVFFAHAWVIDHRWPA